MGFSIGRGLTAIGTGGLSEVFKALTPGKVSAPNLPANPTLNQYNPYPDFSPQELASLQQQQQLLQQYQTQLNSNQQPTAFQQSSTDIGNAENRNYLEALNQAAGQLNVGQKQQQKKDFEKLVAAAGSRGIRILGDDPGSATSDSTAGNQILSDFNQRYQTLADQNRLATIQGGGSQNLARLGFNQNAQSANFGNILNLATAQQQMSQPYQQQRLGAYGTQNANIDIQNQGLLNNYQNAYQNSMNQYQANQQNQANRMGFINSLIGLGGTIGGAVIAGPAGAAAGGQIGKTVGQGMGFNPYTGAYAQSQQQLMARY